MFSNFLEYSEMFSNFLKYSRMFSKNEHCPQAPRHRWILMLYWRELISIYKYIQSQADIDRMVNEAEQYNEKDDRLREKVAAKCSLESYVFSLKKPMLNCHWRINNWFD